MRKLLGSIFLFLLFSSSLFTQQANAQTTTRAVIIGISNYQDEKITDLKYSHKDAQAFVDFLKSNAGGNVPDVNIKMLTNEEATAGQIFRVLDWLIEESGKKDQVIIYFSGHGDVETKTIRQRGYLLAHDTPFNNYRVGAIGLEDLSDVLATLSEVNGSKITIITDACRSGNLAGKNINGTSATASSLAKQFANEVKIMSCQPNEFALEGKQWGGGRGLFSYHFIEGLIGLADNDDDFQVTLKEIGRYLEDHVTEEAAPVSQIPMTVGNRNAHLSFVDEDMLALLKEEKTQQPADEGNSLAAKAPKSNFMAKVDSAYLELYQDFENALADKYFLPVDLNENREAGRSASELYDTLILVAQLAPLYNTMKGNLAAALQDESQQSIIAYLNIDPNEMDKREKEFGIDYQSNPAYLAKAASLLGPDHYLYEKLLAKQYYFEGLIFRLNGELNQQTALYDSAFVKEQIALQYDDQAAYIYNEIGLIKQRKGNYQGAVVEFDSAIVKAPTWILPLGNLLDGYKRIRWADKADSVGNIIISIDSNYYKAYVVMGENFANKNQILKAKEMYLKALTINPDDIHTNNNLASIYINENKNDLAKIYIDKALSLDSTDFFAHYYIATYYSRKTKRDSAIIHYQKAILSKPLDKRSHRKLAVEYVMTKQTLKAKETLNQLSVLDPNHFEYHFGMGFYYSFKAKRDSSIFHYQKAILSDSSNIDAHANLAYEYMYTNQYSKAKETLDQLNVLSPNHFEYHFGMACWNALQENINEGIAALEKAIQNGLKYNRFKNDSDINNLRGSEAYQDLIEEYFPNQ